MRPGSDPPVHGGRPRGGAGGRRVALEELARQHRLQPPRPQAGHHPRQGPRGHPVAATERTMRLTRAGVERGIQSSPSTSQSTGHHARSGHVGHHPAVDRPVRRAVERGGGRESSPMRWRGRAASEVASPGTPGPGLPGGTGDMAEAPGPSWRERPTSADRPASTSRAMRRASQGAGRGNLISGSSTPAGAVIARTPKPTPRPLTNRCRGAKVFVPSVSSGAPYSSGACTFEPWESSVIEMIRPQRRRHVEIVSRRAFRPGRAGEPSHGSQWVGALVLPADIRRRPFSTRADMRRTGQGRSRQRGRPSHALQSVAVAER